MMYLYLYIYQSMVTFYIHLTTTNNPFKIIKNLGFGDGSIHKILAIQVMGSDFSLQVST